MYRKTYIEISTDDLQHNVKTLIRDYPDYSYYIGVVKGNAYGHGREAVKSLVLAGINYLAVSYLEEAVALRNEGLETPILCLQPIHIDEVPLAIEHNVAITLSEYEYFKKLVTQDFLKNLHGELKIHVKVNSGLNRFGISKKEEILEIVNILKKIPQLKLEGIYSHFATTGVHDAHWNNQLTAFKEITFLINLKEIPIVHLGRSLTLLHHEKIDFCNAVRAGVVMYGYYQPSVKPKGFRAWIRSLMCRMDTLEAPRDFKPAFGVKSEIIETRNIRKGDFVGYGAAFEAEEDCRIGFIPIGYADGFFRRNKGGDVAIGGKRYQILAVDMAVVTVLVDDAVHVGDEVELIGVNIPIAEVACRNNTTVYEILCAFKETLPRILI